MKLTFLLICGFVVTLSAAVRAQDQTVTLKVEKMPFIKVIAELKRQTQLDFFYSFNEVDVKRAISLDVKDTKIDEVLQQLLGKAFTWEYVDNMVIIKPTESSEPERKVVRVKGFVYDKQKEPMPGVTVKVVGVAIGTSTNAKGWFAMDLPLLKGALEFSFIGFKKQQVNFTEKSDTLRIIMEEDISDLEEVTVIAYGERNRREVISSISSVKGDEIKEIPTSSFTNLLQGRMAGVEITNQSGSPGGGGTRVAVRGYNSLMVTGASDGQPLYVIDGIPMHSFTSPVTGTNALAELDPSTIESVEVLKDAAAASIYGSRAGNGVILITTKKGKVGRANFSANVSYSASVMPKFPFQLAGREERWWRIQQQRNYRQAKYNYSTKTGYYPTSCEDAYYNGGQYDKFWNAGGKLAVNYLLQDSLNPFYNNQTNWWKQMFRTGEVVNANLQASGGNEKIRYMVGMGYYTEDGIMINSSFKRANFITNLNMKPAKRIRLDSRLYLAYTDKSRNAGRGNATAIEGMTADPKITSTLLPGGGEVEKEILEYLNGTVDRSDSYRMMLNANLGVDIIEGLNFTTSLGLDYSQNNANVFTPSYLDLQGQGENLSKGQVVRNIGITQENLLRYTRNIHDIHRFEVLAGLTYTKNQYFKIAGSGKRGASDNVYYVDGNHEDTHDYGTTDYPDVKALKNYSSSFTEQVMVSYLGRVAYNYKQKYLMEFTFRRDGSSAFGEDVRYANFPAIAVGWSFGEESFIKDWAHWLSMGKFRASWGTSGQTLSDPYLAHGVINLGNSFMGNQGTAAPMINRDLSWEKSDQYDFGLDLDLFNYRLKFKLDYYYKYTKSLLYEVTLPGDVLGSSSQWQNAMEVSNEGVELELVGDIIRKSGLSWRTRFNISRNWNRFEKSYTGMDIDKLVIGRPLYGLYLYEDAGIIQNSAEVPRYSNSDGSVRYLAQGEKIGQYLLPGRRMIRDVNGDGSITDSDKVYTSGTLPLASGGWAHEIIWKNFDLNLLFVYTIKRDIINMYARSSLYGETDPVFYDYRGHSFWEKEGDDTDFVALGFNDESLLRSRLESVNYLRLKTLSLGYNVPAKVLKPVGLSGARIFFTGENLFMWTNYSGNDPETIDITRGQDTMSTYPLARKFTFGLTINF